MAVHSGLSSTQGMHARCSSPLCSPCMHAVWPQHVLPAKKGCELPAEVHVYAALQPGPAGIARAALLPPLRWGALKCLCSRISHAVVLLFSVCLTLKAASALTTDMLLSPQAATLRQRWFPVSALWLCCYCLHAHGGLQLVPRTFTMPLLCLTPLMLDGYLCCCHMSAAACIAQLARPMGHSCVSTPLVSTCM
jgi:hypothetical protein